MKIQQTEVRTIDLQGTALLEDLLIDETRYDLKISNHGGDLTLEFLSPNRTFLDFFITIRNGRINFMRAVHRPNHDHDDSQWLLARRDHADFEEGDQQLCWARRSYQKEDPLQPVNIPFGPLRVDY